MICDVLKMHSITLLTCRIGDEVSRVEALQVVLEWAGQLDEAFPWE